MSAAPSPFSSVVLFDGRTSDTIGNVGDNCTTTAAVNFERFSPEIYRAHHEFFFVGSVAFLGLLSLGAFAETYERRHLETKLREQFNDKNLHNGILNTQGLRAYESRTATQPPSALDACIERSFTWSLWYWIVWMLAHLGGSSFVLKHASLITLFFCTAMHLLFASRKEDSMKKRLEMACYILALISTALAWWAPVSQGLVFVLTAAAVVFNFIPLFFKRTDHAPSGKNLLSTLFDILQTLIKNLWVFLSSPLKAFEDPKRLLPGMLINALEGFVVLSFIWMVFSETLTFCVPSGMLASMMVPLALSLVGAWFFAGKEVRDKQALIQKIDPHAVENFYRAAAWVEAMRAKRRSKNQDAHVDQWKLDTLDTAPLYWISLHPKHPDQTQLSYDRQGQNRLRMMPLIYKVASVTIAFYMTWLLSSNLWAGIGVAGTLGLFFVGLHRYQHQKGSDSRMIRMGRINPHRLDENIYQLLASFLMGSLLTRLLFYPERGYVSMFAHFSVAKVAILSLVVSVIYGILKFWKTHNDRVLKLEAEESASPDGETMRFKLLREEYNFLKSGGEDDFDSVLAEPLQQTA